MASIGLSFDIMAFGHERAEFMDGLSCSGHGVAPLIGGTVGTRKLFKVISIMVTRRCTSCFSPIVAIAKGMKSWRGCSQTQRSGNNTKTQIVLMGDWRSDYSQCYATMGKEGAVF